MAIYHDVEQGSEEWLTLRLGIPTASCFDKIITPAKGELSKQARGYAFQLCAEKLLNRPMDAISTEWMERGKVLEPEAVAAYEFREEVSTVPAGFFTTNDGRIGASPDRLIVGASIGLEVKCPAPQTHIAYLIDGSPAEVYRTQVQGQMYVAELEASHMWSYHPEMPGILIKTCRDEPFIRKLAAALKEFCDMKDAMLEDLQSMGWFEARQSVVNAAESEAMERAALVPDDGGMF